MLVLWPRSQALAVAEAQGVEAVAGLLEERLAAGALEEAQAALPALAEQAERARVELQQEAQSMWSSLRSGKISAASSRALRLVLKAHQQGLQQGLQEAASAAALRLVSTLAAAPEWLRRSGAVEALADCTALLLGVEGGASQLEALARACAKAAPSECIKLLNGVADRPDDLQLRLARAVAEGLLQGGSAAADAAPSLLQLALAVPGHQELQRQLVEAVASAARAAGAAFKLPCGSIAAVKALAGSSGLQQLLAEALGEALVAKGAAGNFDTVVDLVLAVPHLPELQQKLVQALAADLRARSGSPYYQLPSVMLLLPKLGPWPQFQQLLAPAVADHALLCLSAAAIGSHYSCSSLMTTVSEFLLVGRPELAASHYSRFAEACLAAPETSSYKALTQLLDSGAVRGALALPGVQQLVAAQAANLERMSAEPEFSWCMPEADFPHIKEVGALRPAACVLATQLLCSAQHVQPQRAAGTARRCCIIMPSPPGKEQCPCTPPRPQIEEFLRGPQESATVHFEDDAEAQECAARVIARQHKTKTYSVASALPGVDGTAAFVEVVKSREWFEQEALRRAELRRELEEMRALVRPLSSS